MRKLRLLKDRIQSITPRSDLRGLGNLEEINNSFPRAVIYLSQDLKAQETAALLESFKIQKFSNNNWCKDPHAFAVKYHAEGTHKLDCVRLFIFALRVLLDQPYLSATLEIVNPLGPIISGQTRANSKSSTVLSGALSVGQEIKDILLQAGFDRTYLKPAINILVHDDLIDIWKTLVDQNLIGTDAELKKYG